MIPESLGQLILICWVDNHVQLCFRLKETALKLFYHKCRHSCSLI